nr:ABC-2 family transporter protein [Clostridium sp. AWRP]
MPKSFVRFIPIVFIASILPEPFRLKAPEHPEQFLAFLISMLLAFLLVVAFCMLIYITTFYTLSPMGIRMVMSSLVEFLAGGVIPLPFFPDAIRKIINFIPFASMQNTPYRIYSGNINGMGAVYSILLQLFWTIVLVVGGKLLIKKALKRIVVQGG